MAELLTHLVTFIAGLGAGFVLKIRLDARKQFVSGISAKDGSQGVVNQQGNTVHGHMSGRDVNVKR